MIHGLLEFVRERRTQRQQLTWPRAGRSPATTSRHPKRHLSQPWCRIWRRWPQHFLQHSPSSAPQSMFVPCQLQGLCQWVCSARPPPQEAGTWLTKEARVLRWLWEAIDAWVLLISPSKLVPSMLSLSQPGSFTSHRQGTKMGQKPDMRHGYGNTYFPQPYNVQMRGQVWSLVTPLQLLASSPMSRGHPTSTQGGGPQNTYLPGEEGCC